MNKFLLVFLVFIFSGCDVEIGAAHRSGTVNNDYKEDTVPKNYENALKASNYIVKALMTEQYAYIAENYVDLTIATNLNENDIRSFYGQVKESYGNPKSYLENQWGFVPKTVEGKNLLFSVKIVEHDNKTLHYIIAFINDGEFSKIINLSIKERHRVRGPTEL
jgi:hypothetical protein